MPFSNSYIAILDIGHGNSTVLFERGNSCIVDCGPGSYLLEFLTEEGITHIENIFLSHADLDHIEGLVALLSADFLTIGNVYVNSDGIKHTALWEDVTRTVSMSSVKGGTKLFAAVTRSEGEFKCGEMIVETIGPTAYMAAKSPGNNDHYGRRITSNSASASFRIIWNGQPVAYLAGDIDQIALDDLKDHKIEFSAPLLVFPHHGGDISGGDIVAFTNELCDLTGCDTVVFSIGRNKHSNPRPDVVRAIRAKIGNVRIACTQLSKNCAATQKNTTPVHLNSAFARGKASNSCCSGTFIVELGDSVSYTPDFKSHLAFIAAETTTPICISKSPSDSPI